jgi:hypothetical protein
MSNQRGTPRREGQKLRENEDERGAASYGRRHTGAFLPADEYGSGPVDREIGGSCFGRSSLTPLERVFSRIATRPRSAA